MSSSGIVMNTCRNMNVAVADAISGILKPAYEFNIPKFETTSNVGIILTSTGNIRVIKINQKNNKRNGNLKYTIAKAEIKEINIFPIAILNAIIKLFKSIFHTGAVLVPSKPEPKSV